MPLGLAKIQGILLCAKYFPLDYYEREKLNINKIFFLLLWIGNKFLAFGNQFNCKGGFERSATDTLVINWTDIQMFEISQYPQLFCFALEMFVWAKKPLIGRIAIEARLLGSIGVFS